jgi:hypothetical protein
MGEWRAMAVLGVAWALSLSLLSSQWLVIAARAAEALSRVDENKSGNTDWLRDKALDSFGKERVSGSISWL